MSMKNQAHDPFLDTLKGSKLEDLLWVEEVVAHAIMVYGKHGAQQAGKLLKQIQDEIATRRPKIHGS